MIKLVCTIQRDSPGGTVPLIVGVLSGKGEDRQLWRVSFELDYSGDRALEANVDFPIPLPDGKQLVVTPHQIGPQENGTVNVTLFAIQDWFTLSADGAIAKLLDAGARNVRQLSTTDE